MGNLKQSDAIVCLRSKCQLIFPGPNTICPGCGYVGEPYREIEALANRAPLAPDARLIAAAPKLLNACKLALGAFENNWAIDWNELKRAIADAEPKL